MVLRSIIFIAAIIIGKLATRSRDVSLLNVDALFSGNEYHESLPWSWDDSISSPFYTTYRKNFANLYSGAQFRNKTVCIRRLLLPPEPGRNFIFDGWSNDVPCSFEGPSSLYQRFNAHVRQSFGLLNLPKKNSKTNIIPGRSPNAVTILFIYRHAIGNESHYTSRNVLNMVQLQSMFENMSSRFGNNNNFTSEGSVLLNELGHSKSPSLHIIVKDLAELSFEEQLVLITSVGIIVGKYVLFVWDLIINLLEFIFFAGTFFSFYIIT